MLYFILLSFSNIFFIVLNIFLHLTHIYANSFKFFTYLKMTENRSKRSFLSVICTVLSFRKPLLIIILIGQKISPGQSEAENSINASVSSLVIAHILLFKILT